MKIDIETGFPSLAFNKISPKVMREFERFAVLKQFNEGEIVYLQGEVCHFFSVLLSGAMRVYQSSENGKEITLYKVRKGRGCILTVLCILSQSDFPANTIVEQPSTALCIPAPVFREWIERFEVWRDYVYHISSVYQSEMLSKIASLSFQRRDGQIAGFLLRNANQQQKTLNITHSDIARELGTAREVVSRTLKKFERENLVTLSRGNVTILDYKALLQCHNPPGYAW